MADQYLRSARHQIPAHRKRKSVVQTRQTRLDATLRALVAAIDRRSGPTRPVRRQFPPAANSRSRRERSCLWRNTPAPFRLRRHTLAALLVLASAAAADAEAR